jgi:hypothetical protein
MFEGRQEKKVARTKKCKYLTFFWKGCIKSGNLIKKGLGLTRLELHLDNLFLMLIAELCGIFWQQFHTSRSHIVKVVKIYSGKCISSSQDHFCKNYLWNDKPAGTKKFTLSRAERWKVNWANPPASWKRNLDQRIIKTVVKNKRAAKNRLKIHCTLGAETSVKIFWQSNWKKCHAKQQPTVVKWKISAALSSRKMREIEKGNRLTAVFLRTWESAK